MWGPYLNGPAGMSELNMCLTYREIATAKQEKIDKNQQLTSDFCNIEMSENQRHQQGLESKSSKQQDGKLKNTMKTRQEMIL